MNEKKTLVDKLYNEKSLSLDEYEFLIKYQDEETSLYLKDLANKRREEVYQNKIYIRGLIEISNFCKNDCFYCGIRKSNKTVQRYRLTKEEIIHCCDKGYDLGFRTFVLQGGEDPYLNDSFMCELISSIKEKYSDCAVTLSLGERKRESYELMYKNGADRYLLRHETYDEDHYMKLHPIDMSFSNRIRCLYDLKDIGYQVGCGFMVGSPYQTYKTIAKDLKFIEEFSPDMCGIGPYVVTKNTPFEKFFSGSVDTTCYLLSIIRLIKPNILLPSTTAMGTLDIFGREKGIMSGANVIMPNLSPDDIKCKYKIYDNKASFGDESAENIVSLKERIKEIGYEIVTEKGDIKNA